MRSKTEKKNPAIPAFSREEVIAQIAAMRCSEHGSPVDIQLLENGGIITVEGLCCNAFTKKASLSLVRKRKKNQAHITVSFG